MTWEDIAFHVALVRLDLAVAEAQQIELETRASTAEGRADAAMERLLALVDR